MTPAQWLSLGLLREGRAAFDAGAFRSIEAADDHVVGIPRHEGGHQVLGTASSREEAVVIATILRMNNPG